MNETIRIIKNRRSVRKYKDEQLPDDILDNIIQAGRYAPSGGNLQSVHLIVIQNEGKLAELKRLVETQLAKKELFDGIYQSKRGSITAAKRGGYDFIYNAPTLIVVTNKKKAANLRADSSCVLENMMIAASSLGVGSCWINQLYWLNEDKPVIDWMCENGMHEDETVTGALALGWCAETIGEPLPRHGNEVTYIK